MRERERAHSRPPTSRATRQKPKGRARESARGRWPGGRARAKAGRRRRARRKQRHREWAGRGRRRRGRARREGGRGQGREWSGRGDPGARTRHAAEGGTSGAARARPGAERGGCREREQERGEAETGKEAASKARRAPRTRAGAPSTGDRPPAEVRDESTKLERRAASPEDRKDEAASGIGRGERTETGWPRWTPTPENGHARRKRRRIGGQGKPQKGRPEGGRRPRRRRGRGGGGPAEPIP